MCLFRFALFPPSISVITKVDVMIYNAAVPDILCLAPHHH